VSPRGAFVSQENFRMRRITMRRLMIGLVAVGSLIMVVAGLAAAQPRKPDATLRLSGSSVAVGVGFSWGNGVLTYKGKTYPVQVEGLSVGEVGVTHATAKGDVSHLAKLADFAGNYAAVGAGRRPAEAPARP
jgi:malonyl CoA-acyl carrier protein transacylase